MNRKDRRAKGSKSPLRRNETDAATQSALQASQKMLAQGRQQDAEFVLLSLIETNPSCVTALYNLGLFAGQRGEMEAALGFFKRVIELEPGNGDAMTHSALLSLENGDHSGALALAARASTLAPSARMLTRLGTLYRQAGEPDRARECLASALKLEPDYTRAYHELQELKVFKADDPDFLNLKRLQQKSGALPADAEADILFALAKAHMDIGDTDEAFTLFEKANTLRKTTFKKYDIENFESYAASVIRIFNGDVVRQWRGKGSCRDESAIFIIGMPRSGSTLVDQILSSHPDATSVGEAPFLPQSIRFFANEESKGLFGLKQASITKQLVEALSPALLDDIAAKYLARTKAAGGGARRVVDKMLFNYFSTGLIRLALPNAKIVHCTRDPVDIGLSLWRLNFGAGMPWCYDQRDIGRYYHAYRKVMAHWNALFPGDVMEMNYETMVAQQERETRRLLEFCRLPWDARCLDFHKTGRQVKTASAPQVRQPLYTSSAGKWKKYEKHLGPLIESLKAGA